MVETGKNQSETAQQPTAAPRTAEILAALAGTGTTGRISRRWQSHTCRLEVVCHLQPQAPRSSAGSPRSLPLGVALRTGGGSRWSPTAPAGTASISRGPGRDGRRCSPRASVLPGCAVSPSCPLAPSPQTIPHTPHPGSALPRVELF